MAKGSSQTVGSWAFILGVVIAIIAGIVAGATGGLETYTAGIITLVLVILGLIVGFLNIGEKEITNFLIAAIALIAVGTANLGAVNFVIPVLGTILQALVLNIAVFVAPAALVVALKAIHKLSRSP